METNNPIKSVSKTDSEYRVSNYIILFGGKDLTGEFFTSKTLTDSAYTESGILHVDFEHGFDPDDMGIKSDDVLGYVDWKTAKVDENGIFVERVLNRKAKYMKYIERMIEEGAVGTSSQAVRGKTLVVQDTGEIKEWPLYRDSLTFTPAEPRMISQNVIQAAKSLYEAYPESKSLNNFFSNHKNMDVKSLIEECESLKEIETLLRDAGGFGRVDAKTLVSRIKAIANRDDEQERKVKEALESLFKTSILS